MSLRSDTVCAQWMIAKDTNVFLKVCCFHAVDRTSVNRPQSGLIIIYKWHILTEPRAPHPRVQTHSDQHRAVIVRCPLTILLVCWESCRVCLKDSAQCSGFPSGLGSSGQDDTENVPKVSQLLSWAGWGTLPASRSRGSLQWTGPMDPHFPSQKPFVVRQDFRYLRTEPCLYFFLVVFVLCRGGSLAATDNFSVGKARV